ncbi:hypothetical protein RIF29_28737 [Crotalaria pallida]|uniref:Uncharacterized protein n=1 Tax=Crotalaria pallida TaxID=3830 RepID=A0AAN9EIG3_CROPI
MLGEIHGKLIGKGGAPHGADPGVPHTDSGALRAEAGACLAGTGLECSYDLVRVWSVVRYLPASEAVPDPEVVPVSETVPGKVQDSAEGEVDSEEGWKPVTSRSGMAKKPIPA